MHKWQDSLAEECQVLIKTAGVDHTVLDDPRLGIPLGLCLGRQMSPYPLIIIETPCGFPYPEKPEKLGILQCLYSGDLQLENMVLDRVEIDCNDTPRAFQ